MFLFILLFGGSSGKGAVPVSFFKQGADGDIKDQPANKVGQGIKKGGAAHQIKGKGEGRKDGKGGGELLIDPIENAVHHRQQCQHRGVVSAAGKAKGKTCKGAEDGMLSS